jgi:hypothetical protein
MQAEVKEMWMKQAISLQLTASYPLTSQLKLAAKIQSQVQKGRVAGSIEYVHAWFHYENEPEPGPG